MKRCIFIVTVILLTAFSACSNTDNQDTSQLNLFPGEGSMDVAFELSGMLTETPSTMVIYELQSPDVTNESVRVLGEKLGFTGEAGPTDKGIIGMSDAKTGAMLRVDTHSGAIEFGYIHLDKLFPEGVPTLPSDKEAKRIAFDYLMAVGLLPDDVKVGEVVEGGGSGDIVKHLLVRFERKIEGIPVTGPGAKYGVRIGENGEVVMFLLAHQEIQAPREDAAIITSASAYDHLLAGKGEYVVPMNCDKVVIESMRLAYYMGQLTEQQKLLLPVFEFQGKCLDKDGNYLEDFTGWIEALEVE